MKVLAAVIAFALLAPAWADEREHRLYLRQQGGDTFVAGVLALVTGMGALLLQGRARGSGATG